MNSMARRMFELVEPIGVIPYSADEPNEAMYGLGFTNYWDTYFAGRAAPLGLATAEVVDALFYNFAPGEVARHIPKVWRATTPEAAIAARQIGCVKALRRIVGDRVDSPGFARAAELLTKAATSAPFEGRPMYAALRAIPIPDDVVACLHRCHGYRVVLRLMLERQYPARARDALLTLSARGGHVLGGSWMVASPSALESHRRDGVGCGDGRVHRVADRGNVVVSCEGVLGCFEVLVGLGGVGDPVGKGRPYGGHRLPISHGQPGAPPASRSGHEASARQ